MASENVTSESVASPYSGVVSILTPTGSQQFLRTSTFPQWWHDIPHPSTGKKN